MRRPTDSAAMGMEGGPGEKSGSRVLVHVFVLDFVYFNQNKIGLNYILNKE